MSRPPVALTIAGSDPSGGAGIQADLKTFSALGAFGTSVITALTAQNTLGVKGVHVVPADFVQLQLDTLLDDVRIDAVKIGMLASIELTELLGRTLRPGGRLHGRSIVLDPVMVSTSGSRLLDDAAVDSLRELLPHVSVITPNLPEAAILTGTPVATSCREMSDQAARLLDLGARRVLLKGGHLPDLGNGSSEGGDVVVDLLVTPDGTETITGPRVRTTNTHGTGCTLSSALAALRPQRADWAATVRDARAWLTGALVRGDELDVGSGPGPVHHFHDHPAWATTEDRRVSP